MTNRLASGFLAAFLASGGLMAQTHPVSVQILAINDLHGNLEPPMGSDGKVNGVPAGGTEYLATHLKNAEKDNPNSIIVGAGDLFGASPLLSALSAEKPTIESLDAMHVAVNALGNHELDHGAAVLKTRLKDSHVEYLAANTVEGGKTIFPSTVVKTVGGVKIGFIGEILEAAPSVISGESIRGMSFLDEARGANEAAARLEREGVHAIVLLVHEGGFQHAAAGAQLDPNGCSNFSGEIKEVTEKLSPSIQVVISGHTHVFYNCQIGGHTVTSASAYGRMLTRVALSIDPKTDRILSVTATNEIVTRDVEKDPAQTAIIAKYKPVVDKVSQQPAGSITGAISRKTHTAAGGSDESGESPMGDVIADAQLAATSAPDKGGAVIAFMNSGGIRAELPGPARSVTFGELYSVQPFGNRLTVHTMTGAALKRLLETQFHGSGNPQFLQISDGFTYQYKANAAVGEHIVPGSMKLHGKPIADTDVLRIEASDFMAAGAAFREATDGMIGPVDVDALVDYFKTHSPVAPGPQNRIQRVD